MSEVLPELARKTGKDDISLNVCITSWNYQDLPALAEKSKEWGLPINFSVYSHLRVQDRVGLVQGDNGLGTLKEKIEQVIDLQQRGYPIYTSPRVMWKYYKFLTEGGISGCQAGRKFLVINPDGRLTPCAMVMAYFDKQEDMLKDFTKQNACDACYISTRANTEKTFKEFVEDNTESFQRMLMPWRS